MTLIVDTTPFVVDTHQTPATGGAVSYGAANIEVTIDPGIAVVARDDHAVFSVFDGSTLINNGSIFSASDFGVFFGGANGTIVNNEDHSIVGVFGGIALTADGIALTNHGTVGGLTNMGIFFTATSDNIELNNDGDIYGTTAGIQMDSDNDGGVINNSGTIRSDIFWGVSVSTDSGLTTVINNKAGGLIKGASNGILTLDGGISLDNRGTVDGGINCNATNQNDIVTNRGDIIGDVLLGSGDDTFAGVGNSSSGDVFGEDGDDMLIGGNANDTLDGGPGSDLLRGGKGRDSLFGGTDSDTFDFNSKKDSKKGGKRDTIKDFDRSDDTIDLRTIDAKKGGGNQTFKWIGKNDFHDKKGELRYEKKGGSVIVQGDIKGNGKADFEIKLDDISKLSADDFVL